MAQRMDPSRIRLLVSSSALFVSSPAAAEASARPSQGLVFPASQASGECHRRTLSCSASRRSCASGILRSAVELVSSYTAFMTSCSPPMAPQRNARAGLCFARAQCFLLCWHWTGYCKHRWLRLAGWPLCLSAHFCFRVPSVLIALALPFRGEIE